MFNNILKQLAKIRNEFHINLPKPQTIYNIKILINI